MLAVATYHVTLSSGSQAAVAYTSVGKAFFTFAGIFSYHIYTRHTNESKVQYMKCGSQLPLLKGGFYWVVHILT